MNIFQSFFSHRFKRIIFSVVAFLACVASVHSVAVAQSPDDMDNFDWVIYVKDTQLMKGPLKEPITIDFEAVNTSGNIQGEYTGSAVMTFGKDLGDVSAKVVSTSKTLNFTLGPYLPPLTNTPDPKNQPEYAGQGQMTMVTVGTGTADGQSRSRSFETTRPIAITVNKTEVELVVTYPKGTVTYHGYIIGEGKGTHKAKVEKEKQGKAKREKKAAAKPQPKPRVDPSDLEPLAPLTPLNDETPELAPLKPVTGEEIELAPLEPLKNEGPELAPLKPVTSEDIELAPLTPVK